MAKSTKNNFRPTKRTNYKKVVRMSEGGNVSELNYSERKEYIEQHYAPFITEAKMIFSVFDSGLEYDLNGDSKEVKEKIIDHYKSLSDYTEQTLKKETIYEIQDWDLIRRDIDPENDEIIGETTLEEVSSDNTYNFSYLGAVHLNWRVYHDDEYDKYFYVITPHLGGDIRGNYGEAFILEGNDKDELFYRFYEGFISGGASVYIKFKDGSAISFDSEQDSDVFYFRVNESDELTGMAQKYLEDFQKFDSWQGDEFLSETVDVFLMRKGIAPKMMSGGNVNDETPRAYVQILGYDEGKWMDLTDFSDGDDVISHITEWMDGLNEKFGGNREEYMIADYEGFGTDLYDEYMGSNEFDEILEGYEKYKKSDFPKEVIVEYKKDSGSSKSSLADVIEQMDNNYLGQYDDYSDFGSRMIEDGVYSPTASDVYVTDTDKRILASEESDNQISSMDFDDLIERADDTRFEYEKEKNQLEEKINEVQDDIDALNELQNSTDEQDDFDDISDRIEEKELELEDLQESLDNIDGRYEDSAKTEVQQILYDEVYSRLENDLSSFLEEFGYEDELESVNFLSVDYDAIGQYLASDYLVIEYDGSLYIFNNFSKGGRVKATKQKTKYDFYIVENNTKKLVSGYNTKEEAVKQRKLLIEQYPSMRFEIYPLAKLEASTDLDVNSKNDYVELSALDKIKKVSVDAYRYGKEKVGQAKLFLEKNDVKGKIKRGARKVADKTKQGADWLRKQWMEADFGDGTGRAKFFADGGEILKNAKIQAEKTGYEYVVYSDLKGEISFARKNDFERFFDKNESKILYTVDEKGNVNEVDSEKQFADGGEINYEKVEKANEIYREHNLERIEKGIENFSQESVDLWNNNGYDDRLKKLNLTFEERQALNPKKWFSDGGGVDSKKSTLQEKIDHINNTYYDVVASKMYSDNRIQVVSPYFNTLNEIKRKEFNGNGFLERHGNLSSYVLYSNEVYADGGGVDEIYYVVTGLEKRHDLQYGDSQNFKNESEAIKKAEEWFKKDDVGESIVQRVNKTKNTIDTVYRINDTYPLGERVVERPRMFADGVDVNKDKYEDWEMVVIAKEEEKDGGNYHKFEYLVSARNVEEAKQIATNLWNKEWSMSDLFIFKVMTESLYNLKYSDKFANGGGVDYEPMTKPVPTTKPSTQPTKPDKNNPYKPKAIPKPKASKL